MELTEEQKAQIERLIVDKKQDLEQFLVLVKRDIAHREGQIDALKALLEEPKEDGGKKDE
jgi:hypothetical protein